MQRFMIMGLIWMLGGCGIKMVDPSSEVKTAFGASDVRFLSKADLEHDSLATSMGVLSRVAEIQGELYASPLCSAFRISPMHVLSAAHCYLEGGTFAFDQTYLASDPDPSLAGFENISGQVRLTFTGLPEADFLKNLWKKNPLLGAPEFLDHEHDIAIWSLSERSAQPYIDLDRTTDRDLTQLKLYAYPNGNPLALSTPCFGIIWGSGEVIRHDCDSFSGSSGGLLATSKGEPVALHVAGPGSNDWQFYANNGHFETKENFAAELMNNKSSTVLAMWECKKVADEEARRTCMVGDGMNRAVRLDVVWNLVMNKNPKLAEQLIQLTKTLTPR